MPQKPSFDEFMQKRAPVAPMAAHAPTTAAAAASADAGGFDAFMKSRSPQPPPGEEEWSVGGFLGNVGASTGRLVGGAASALIHPLDTVRGITQMALGAGEKVTGPDSYFGRELRSRREDIGADPNSNPVDEMLASLKERYLGWENLKKTAYHDPAGLAADVAMLFSGVGEGLGVAGKASGLAKLTEAGATATKWGRRVDPINLSMKVTGKIARPIARAGGNRLADALGITTGAGTEAIKHAYNRPTQKFLEAMRGHVDIDEIVDNMKRSIQKLRSDTSAEYRNHPARQTMRTTMIDASPVMQTLTDELDNFGVQIVPDPTKPFGVDVDFNGPNSTIGDVTAQNEVREIVNEILAQPGKSRAPMHALPAHHVDSLKRRIDSKYSQSSEARALTASVRKATRDTLSAVPGYDEMAKDYENATRFIRETESELSGKSTTAKGSAVRKLAYALNQSTDYRQMMIEALDKRTGAQLKDQIAGFALSKWAPRGLMRTVAGANILYALANGMGIGKILDLLLTSPRGLGEAVSAAGDIGRAAAKGKGVVRAAVNPALYRPAMGMMNRTPAAPLPPPSDELHFEPGQPLRTRPR